MPVLPDPVDTQPFSGQIPAIQVALPHQRHAMDACRQTALFHCSWLVMDLRHVRLRRLL
jgi:hypothetical protein